VSDRVEIVETVWNGGLPVDRSRRLLRLLFAPSSERDDAESGETDNHEGKAA
jgi:hypothetical protein